MNVKLLRKVKKHILEEPLRYDQNEIIRMGQPGTSVSEFSNRIFPVCGTVACIGGWVEVLTRKRKSRYAYALNYRNLARKLGIKHTQVARLVAYSTDSADGNSWPEKFRNRYNKAARPETKAKIAAERIEHFIKTKGKE